MSSFMAAFKHTGGEDCTTPEVNCMAEDLTVLPVQLYEPIVMSMHRRGVSPPYIAASVCQYAQSHLFSPAAENGSTSGVNESSLRDIIEAIERLIPNQKGLVSSTTLFHFLRIALFVGASDDCRTGLESMIGKQLEEATVDDLLIPSQAYADVTEYGVESVKRILKHFYMNYVHSSDVSGLHTVAELVEQLLLEVSGDTDLTIESFVSLAEASNAASRGIKPTSDGIYTAIKLFFRSHPQLTEVEREEVCMVLDCGQLSPEACDDVAKNNMLPVRFVVQFLFLTQLKLRDAVVQVMNDKMKETAVEDDELAGKTIMCREKCSTDLESMSLRVQELERQYLVLRNEIHHGCCHQKRKEKLRPWNGMKRKLRCMKSLHFFNSISKKRVNYTSEQDQLGTL